MRFNKGETVTIVRPTRDRHGDVLTDTDTDIDGCAVWTWMSRSGGSPASHALESMFEGQTVIWGLAILFPPGTDVRSSDQLRVRGSLYMIYGEPEQVRSPITGREPGVLVYARSGTG